MPKASRPPRVCKTCPGSPPASSCAHATSHRKGKTDKAPPKSTVTNVQAKVVVTSPSELTTVKLEVPGRPPAFPNTPGGITTIDPRLLALASPSPMASLPATPIRAAPMDEPCSPTKSEIPSTPRRPTVKNPIYGLVDGVKRGNTSIDVIRHKAPRKPIRDAPTATRRFNRLIMELVNRCEQASIETGCWLYLSAQHVNATSSFINFASPRLRRELGSELLDIQNSFSRVYGAAVSARRADAIRLVMQAQVDKDQLELMRQDIAAKAAHIAELEKNLNEYQSHVT